MYPSLSHWIVARAAAHSQFRRASYSTFQDTRFKRRNASSPQPVRRTNPSTLPPPISNQDQEGTEQSSQFFDELASRGTGDTRSGLATLLANDRLIVTRQIEMLNIFAGFEQSNKYAISNEDGDPVGFIAEEDRGIMSVFSRQLFRTHRPFHAVVMDQDGVPLLILQRPFAWINSRMSVTQTQSNAIIKPGEGDLPSPMAEVHQRWHPWRRRYELFLRGPQDGHQVLEEDITFSQFARVDGPFFAWHFMLQGQDGSDIASIDRAFRGFGREIFTDTGQYTIDFQPSTGRRSLNLDERSLILGLAVNIDVDYFSRHSHGGGFGSAWMFSSWE